MRKADQTDEGDGGRTGAEEWLSLQIGRNLISRSSQASDHSLLMKETMWVILQNRRPLCASNMKR